MPITALAINCTLKASPAASSCDRLLRQVLAALDDHGVSGDILRAVDYNIKPGVSSDEGEGDDWPGIRKRILDADILLFGTPVWLGHPSSVCQRVLERLDAFLGETDAQRRMISYGRVAAAVVVGNEDGAHHIVAEIFQGLNDLGFTIPASACSYWVGEAMQGVDYKDLDKTPDPVNVATQGLARNAAHLARLLQKSPYPAA